MPSGVTTQNKLRTNEKIPQLYLDSQDAGRKAYVLDLISINGEYYAGFKVAEQTVCLLGDDDLVACYLAGCIFRSIYDSAIYYMNPVSMTDDRNNASDPGVSVQTTDKNVVFKVDDQTYSTLKYVDVLGYHGTRSSK